MMLQVLTLPGVASWVPPTRVACLSAIACLIHSLAPVYGFLLALTFHVVFSTPYTLLYPNLIYYRERIWMICVLFFLCSINHCIMKRSRVNFFTFHKKIKIKFNRTRQMAIHETTPIAHVLWVETRVYYRDALRATSWLPIWSQVW